jgi:hypothetical protein
MRQGLLIGEGTKRRRGCNVAGLGCVMCWIFIVIVLSYGIL